MKLAEGVALCGFDGEWPSYYSNTYMPCGVWACSELVSDDLALPLLCSSCTVISNRYYAYRPPP